MADAMTGFLKNNYALVAGILLPLLLVAAFFMIGEARLSTAPDPQHDAVFAKNYTDRSANSRYKIGLDDGKLYIRVRPPPAEKPARHQREPVLFVFDHTNRQARKIDIDFDNVVKGKVVDPDLDTLNKNRISSTVLSPDGYKFEYLRRGRGGLIREIFGSRRRHRSNYALVKQGRMIPVVGTEPIWTAHFIGWIEK